MAVAGASDNVGEKGLDRKGYARWHLGVALASRREQKRRLRSVEAKLGGDGSRELGLALAH
jgi:hypothetical protein